MWSNMKSERSNYYGKKCNISHSTAKRSDAVVAISLQDLTSLEVPESNLKKVHPMPQSIASAPISFPKSHIRRTPSELELEALTLRAEYEDARMYSRLVCGMYHQIQHRCSASGGCVHPLSNESIQCIVKAKLARDQELVNHEEYDGSDTDGGWDVSYMSIDDENHSSMSSRSSTFSSSHGSMSSMLSAVRDIEKGDQEEECVFDIEL